MSSAWLYQRIFHDPGPGGRHTDALLRRKIGPALHLLAADGAIDRYHFLRYNEGGFHIRLRVRTRQDEVRRVWDGLDVALADCEATRERATYEPETQKFGGVLGLDLAERWFTVSTDFSLGVLQADPTESERLVACASTTLALLAELRFPADVLAQVLEDYRGIWAFYGYPKADIPVEGGRLPSELCGASLDRWERATRSLVDKLEDLDQQTELGCSRTQFLLNVAHLNNNRIGLSPGGEMAMVDLVRTALGPGPRV